MCGCSDGDCTAMTEKAAAKLHFYLFRGVQLANTRKAPSQLCPTEERGAPVQHHQQGKEVETCNFQNEGLQCRWLNVVLVQIHSPLSQTIEDVQFLPITGLLGTNMKARVDKSICSWWNGPCLFDILDCIEVPLRDPKGPVRMPIIDKYKDMGTVVMGKIESGTISEGDNFLVMPNKANVKVISVYCDEDKVRSAAPGENARVKLSGIEEEDITAGFVRLNVPSAFL